MPKTKMRPRKLTDVPQYAEAKARESEIRAELAEVERQIQEAYADLGNATSIEIEAQAMLDGAELDPAHQETPKRHDLKLLRRRQQVAKRALLLVEERLRHLQADASRQIVEPLVPGYRELVQEMAEAVLKLSRLADEEERFRDELSRDDIRFASHIRPMPVRGFGLRDPQSYATRWLNEASEHYGINLETDVTPGVGQPDVMRGRRAEALKKARDFFASVRKSKGLRAPWVD